MNSENPFAKYGIKSVAVPMFFNQSVLPNTAQSFTAQFFKLLASYRGLKVYSGSTTRADAVLLGVISSSPLLNKTIAVEGHKKAQTLVNPKDIGNRNDFFTPSRNRITLTLKVVLIKNPNWQELEFFQSKISQGAIQHPKVIFNKTVSLSTAFDRVFKSRGKGGVTNFTNNLGTLNKAVETLALDGRNYFKEIVINAF